MMANSASNGGDVKSTPGDAGSVIARVLADGELVHEMIPRDPMDASDASDASDAAPTVIRHPPSADYCSMTHYDASPSPYVPSSDAYTTINAVPRMQAYAVVNGDPFYRDYFGAAGPAEPTHQPYVQSVRYAAAPGGDGHEVATTFVERFIRQGGGGSGGAAGGYKQSGTGLTVDLPSPDSGIGTDAVTPRDQSVVQQVLALSHSFIYISFSRLFEINCKFISYSSRSIPLVFCLVSMDGREEIKEANFNQFLPINTTMKIDRPSEIYYGQ